MLSFSVWMSADLTPQQHTGYTMGFHLLSLRHRVGISHSACWDRNHLNRNQWLGDLNLFGSQKSQPGLSIRLFWGAPFQWKNSFCWPGFPVLAKSDHRHPSDITTFQLVAFPPSHSLAKMPFWKQLQVALPPPRKRLRLKQVCYLMLAKPSGRLTHFW